MRDYQQQLDRYSWPDTREISQTYLAKYWLSDQAYTGSFATVRQKVFPESHFTSERTSFNNNYEAFSTVGGVLFSQEELLLIQKYLGGIDDQVIIVEQDHLSKQSDHLPPLRMRYPKDIKWEAIFLEGEGISYELFRMSARNYFVFGDSGLWGKYAANDWRNPRDYWIFAPRLRPVFLEFLSELTIIENE